MVVCKLKDHVYMKYDLYVFTRIKKSFDEGYYKNKIETQE